MVTSLPQRFIISVGETRVCRVNFTDDLDSGVTFVTTTGYPAATCSATELTISTSLVKVNTATYVESNTGDTVAVGKAIQFAVSGGTAANSPYAITVSGKTNSTPAEILVRQANLTFA